jgi:Rod binding domain-containing protein
MQTVQAIGAAIPLENQPAATDHPAAKADAARQFEALLITQLLRAARGDGDGWLGAGADQTAASAMELAEEQFAGALSAQGGLGLANLIVAGLERDQALQPCEASSNSGVCSSE